MEGYNLDYYVNPRLSYANRLSDKFRIGHLIYDTIEKCIVKVSPSILQKMVENELPQNRDEDFRFSPLFIKNDWLTKVFGFEKKYLNANGMTVFTSTRNGLKIHFQSGNYYLGYILREKQIIAGMNGNFSSKPEILFINELMDFCFLIKRDKISFSDDDVKKINEIIIP
ncbi:hypothetical protein [[Muricauda] lutisoli]|uniref:Uncharacterized protein n=1 Tax=[Muricauda] lutisoli TaxID=2816035 RepID=A0ABS3EV48_9FLAO|nr:hypothetical protein [[Muricauda] lutisoli]MBO0330088.1 hypothetical protein [[Muricauda] lutisoli]